MRGHFTHDSRSSSWNSFQVKWPKMSFQNVKIFSKIFKKTAGGITTNNFPKLIQFSEKGIPFRPTILDQIRGKTTQGEGWWEDKREAGPWWSQWRSAWAKWIQSQDGDENKNSWSQCQLGKYQYLLANDYCWWWWEDVSIQVDVLL